MISLWKTKPEAYEKFVKISRNDEYTRRNLLDYLYPQKFYKLIGIGLSRQSNTSMLKQINFTGKLEGNNYATMFSISEKQQKKPF